jgi:hypothetical protein
VSSRSGGNHPQQVSRHNNVAGGSTNSLLRAITKGIDAARAHIAVPAAKPQFPKTALGLLGQVTVPGGFQAFITGNFKHLQGSRIDGTGILHGIPLLSQNSKISRIN